MVNPSSKNAQYLYKMGKITFSGHKETWYSQKKVPGKGLKIPGRHVGKEGFVMDGNNFICVATIMVAMNKEIKTSFGKGKRYDKWSSPKVVALYTDWK